MPTAKPEVNRSQIIRDFVKKNPTSSVAEVVAALAKSGVEVSKNHVYIVISKMKAKKQQKRADKAAATASSNGKAPSKSSVVRDFLRENRHLTAKEVVSAMAEKGISVTEGLVYFVKGQMKGKRGRKKKVVAPVATVPVFSAPVSANGDAVKTILKIRGWASEVGGMTKLKGLVDALSE